MKIKNRHHGQVHDLSDELLQARTVDWLRDEAQDETWWAAAITSSGRIIHQAYDGCHGEGYAPDVHMQDYAHRVLIAVNQANDRGGAWIVGWFFDCKRFYLLYKDADGDIHIPIECDKPWIMIAAWPIDTWVNMTQQAWHQWAMAVQCIDDEAGVRPGDKVKLAQGQRGRRKH